MGWEHWTEWLQPGEVLTGPQYGELLDAIEERMHALHADLGWGADMTAIRNTGIRSFRGQWSRVELPVSPTNREALFWVVYELAFYYGYGLDAPGATGETWNEVSEFGVFFRAAEELGYIADEDDGDDQGWVFNLFAAMEEDGVELWQGWNMLRRAVQLLTLPMPLTASLTNWEKVGATDYEDMQTATEDEIELGEWLASFDGSRTGKITRGTVKLPPALYGSYSLWVRDRGGNPGAWRWYWNGTPSAFANSSSDTVRALGSGLGASGTIDTRLDFVGWEPGDGPPSAFTVRGVTSLTPSGPPAGPFYALPTFTHPYEPISP